MELTKEIKEKFVDIACQLSPENLSCDGELPKAESNRRFRNLNAEWHGLERQIGRVVDESEVWDW